MSRESDLTHFWLKGVESELSQVSKFGVWVESELSQSRNVKFWVEAELNHWIWTWVRVESVRKIWAEHSPGKKTGFTIMTMLLFSSSRIILSMAWCHSRSTRLRCKSKTLKIWVLQTPSPPLLLREVRIGRVNYRPQAPELFANWSFQFWSKCKLIFLPGPFATLLNPISLSNWPDVYQVYQPKAPKHQCSWRQICRRTVPSRPENVTFAEVNDRSLKLLWTRPRRPNGHLLGYRVYWSAEGGAVQSSPLSAGDTTSFTLTSLGEAPDQRGDYTCQVSHYRHTWLHCWQVDLCSICAHFQPEMCIQICYVVSPRLGGVLYKRTI